MRTDKIMTEKMDENSNTLSDWHEISQNTRLIIEVLLDIRKILRDNKKICKK